MEYAKMQTKTVCSYMGRVDKRTDENGTKPEIGPILRRLLLLAKARIERHERGNFHPSEVHGRPSGDYNDQTDGHGEYSSRESAHEIW